MIKALQDNLIEKYPGFFDSMHWGFECGDGWYDLIDNLCMQIQEHIKKNKLEEFQVNQVKEKFGQLRFYASHADEYIYELIDNATIKSSTTCEKCGAPGEHRNSSGWLYVSCDNHIRK